MKSECIVVFYDGTGRKVVRRRAYRTPQLAWRAIKRAQARGQIVGWGWTRTADDPPTCHH